MNACNPEEMKNDNNVCKLSHSSLNGVVMLFVSATTTRMDLPYYDALMEETSPTLTHHIDLRDICGMNSYSRMRSPYRLTK